MLLLIYMSGCALSQPLPTPTLPTPSPEFTPTFTPTILPTITPTSTITPAPTTETAVEVCSPLEGIDRSKLHEITSNPFKAPNPYVDNSDRHPAIDFSFYGFESYTTFANFPIQSILPGKVILIENDRFPYGNMILIETPFTQVDPGFLATIPQPTPLPPSIYTIDERCPVNGTPVTWNLQKKSLYVLYAHLAQEPDFSKGDIVSCGQNLGLAGKTGNAVEEHLHLEIRIGPSNAHFSSIGNYHSMNTPEERYNYCIWSLSGVFQPIDPAVLLYP